MIRVAVRVEGVVQGVGFRPFVHRAATRRGLSGWVRNGNDGVRIEVQGERERVREFVDALRREAPRAARVGRLEAREIPTRDETGFAIAESRDDAEPRPSLPPDLATCAECAAEIASPSERRHAYPFTNCTQCGPRFTLIERLPYDRARTSMARFALCADCLREYGDPADRRFHAQPIACPACGPSLRLCDPKGFPVARGASALDRAVDALDAGEVLAVKGLGGFQLLVDATSAGAVARLRARKRREDKPFALLVASLAAAREACALDVDEEALLASPRAPIVLARRRAGAAIVDGVAPRNPLLGVMLPTTPLHHLIAARADRPLVCTSGNLSDEPICTDDDEALARLAGVADRFLAHDRPVVRPVDDSVVRLGPSGPRVLRRARGYAPLPHPFPDGACVLALGAQLKSTIALAKDGQAVVSQHLGDLFSPEATLLLERTARDFIDFFEARPEVVACDLHPDYASTRLAERLASEWDVPLERVQHHHAHVAACVAEHQVDGAVLGLAWDGAGLGTDGALWGGEALVVDGARCRRAACLRPFSLVGGERAIREPRRAALGVLHEMFGPDAASRVGSMFTAVETRALVDLLARRVRSPRTTSVGRLFDAVAALVGLRARATFEGQAAAELEWAAELDPAGGAAEAAGAASEGDRDAYPFPLVDGDPLVADWEPLVRRVLDDLDRGVARAIVAARFHRALVDLAERIALRVDVSRVVLGGGCFQNQALARGVHDRLVARGFQVHLPERFPPNDGGVSLGQAYVAALRRKEGRCASGFPVRW